ncbi:uncharacterized protein EDB91DRAFT_575104 [Suillus paluster]|uniref:uncharacterized protein n=1 Tax=Suillus paluster TaxID=48578 RepID=UPI001B87263D|nr:uncharacterized protein EDB91DRAFT_575104 [Suillus paluster]KAG1734886.1 hypothetical protein EDB91DRAFT_575104 [Suillus paluster]
MSLMECPPFLDPSGRLFLASFCVYQSLTEPLKYICMQHYGILISTILSMSMIDDAVSPSATLVRSRHVSHNRISSGGNHSESQQDQNQSEPWCKPPKNAFWRLWFKALCMIAVSKPSLEHWDDLIHDRKKDEWEEHKKMVIDRLGNMNVTAGLVLTTSAVFISTNPPFQPLMPYASHGSYILQVAAFVAALISLMTGTSVLIIYDTCYAGNDMKDLLKSLKRNRRRLVCCLLLMAYPSMALAVSTLALMTAVFIAGFTSDKLFVQILTAFTYVTLILLALLALYVFSSPWRDKDVTNRDNQPSSEPKDVRDSGISQSNPQSKELTEVV